MSVNETRAKINALDMARRNLVNELLSKAEDDETKFDLWMEYAIKRDYTYLNEGQLGEDLTKFLVSLQLNDEITLKTTLYVEEIVGLIYTNYMEYDKTLEIDTEKLDVELPFDAEYQLILKDEGKNLLNELINRNIGSIYIDF